MPAKRKTVAVRDPEQTRARILAAAKAEFARVCSGSRTATVLRFAGMTAV